MLREWLELLGLGVGNHVPASNLQEFLTWTKTQRGAPIANEWDGRHAHLARLHLTPHGPVRMHGYTGRNRPAAGVPFVLV